MLATQSRQTKKLFSNISQLKEILFYEDAGVNKKYIHITSVVANKKAFYDIIIAGGGMVGTTLGCLLGQAPKLSNKKILLLEGSPGHILELKPNYSNRVVALNNNTKSLLKSINAWRHIENVRYKPVRKIQVWDACSDAMITFNDEMVHDLAYIVENDVLLAAVNNQVRESGNVTVLNDARIQGYQLPRHDVPAGGGGVTVNMTDGTAYSCSLLIGADGANSKVRKAMGVHHLGWSYKQLGVVATLRLSEPTENVVAWQRFLPTGPVALLPLTDDLSSLVWSTTEEDAARLLKLPEESFVDALNSALWKQFPRDSIIDAATQWLNVLLKPALARQLQPSIASIVEGSRAAFPLGFGHSSRYVVPGVVLVGDAAHRVHPLAGQGVNLGFGDVQCLCDVLSRALYSGAPIGSMSYLCEYETLRQRHNVPLMLAVDALHKLYHTSSTPLILLRSLGLQLTQALEPLKGAIMKQAAV